MKGFGSNWMSGTDTDEDVKNEDVKNEDVKNEDVDE